MSSDDRAASGVAQRTRAVYVERVNAVIDHIEANLARELTLDALAEVAHFSPFHFHRLFAALVGETPHRFIARVRVERVASRLLQRPGAAITEIAAECGFVTPSSFARAFKDTYAMSATEWRSGGSARHVQSLRGRALVDPHEAGYGIVSLGADGRGTWTIGAPTVGPAVVRLERVPDLEIAYVRHTGRYQGMAEVFARIFGQLMRWAQPRELLHPQTWVLAIYHDDPQVTSDDRLRVSAAIDVPPGTVGSGGVGRMLLGGGVCAVARFELGAADYVEAWDALMAGWLPESGFEPDDRFPFERFPMIEAAGTGRMVVDLCLPVRPLSA